MARERVPWEESGKGKVTWLRQGRKHGGRDEETRGRGAEKEAQRGKVTIRERRQKHMGEKNIHGGKKLLGVVLLLKVI